MSGGGGKGQLLEPQYGPTIPGASYTPVESNVYRSTLPSDSSKQAPQTMSPLVRQMTQQYTPIEAAGLTAMMSALVNQPQASGIASLPVYRPGALNYRPNMQAVQQNLFRVKPNV